MVCVVQTVEVEPQVNNVECRMLNVERAGGETLTMVSWLRTVKLFPLVSLWTLKRRSKPTTTTRDIQAIR